MVDDPSQSDTGRTGKTGESPVERVSQAANLRALASCTRGSRAAARATMDGGGLPDPAPAAPARSVAAGPSRVSAAEARRRRLSAPGAGPVATGGTDPVAAIAGRLAVDAAPLLRPTVPGDAVRLASLVARAVASIVDQRLAETRRRVAASGAGLSSPSRRRLQDVALRFRPDPDLLVADVSRALAAADLLALVHASCEARDHGSADALRCRAHVLGGGNVMAREAALDMKRSGIGESGRLRIDAVIARHVRAAIGDALDDAPDLRDAVEAALSPPDDGPSGETGADLRERDLERALACGDRSAGIVLLADGAGVDRHAVGEAVERRDGRALVSLAWKAGFRASLSDAIQIVLGRAAPDDLLRGAGADGFPLGRAQMQWESEGFRRA